MRERFLASDAVIQEETVEIEQQSETSKEEDEVVEGKKEEEVAKESDKEESAADNSALIDETLISPEFKEAMDSYEAFFDEYVEYMKAYNDNPTDAELLMGMSDMLAREADMIKAFDEWEEDHDMTTAEEAYYLEVHSRIYAKLAEVM